MNFLIDTHCWLWWLSEPERLNARARRWIADRKNAVFFSAASAWEIAIKAALGKLRLPEPAANYVPSRVSAQGMVPLPINQRHALHLETMPSHHRDPFDRMLIAQAQIEALPILTADEHFLPYDVKVLWAGASPGSHQREGAEHRKDLRARDREQDLVTHARVAASLRRLARKHAR